VARHARKPTPQPKERPFFAFGNVVNATIAIGNVANGTIAIGFSLSVGVVSIGMNAVGSFAAIGLNAVGPISVAAINGVGVITIAGVNGFGSVGFAAVNNGMHPLVGIVVAVGAFIASLVHYNKNKGDAEPVDKSPGRATVPIAVARESGGWVRATIRAAARAEWALLRDASGSIDAQITPGLEATIDALSSDDALVELRIATMPASDEGGYRDAGSERVAVIVNAMKAPARRTIARAARTWLARPPSRHLASSVVGLVLAAALAIAAAVH
jgi:hypothetical protein